ncbi:MAG: glucose-1-phosphate thymidylyltransferase RfbA [Bacilli bacterium]|jgi:glucose-1-phosphate thymidylyltransferase|nr:glucose-1-phosphate thymidylyltransferase RfbA [Bacilli bacterium]
MKGIILAGGSGTRLYPLTLVTSKQLLPIYNKPMIYYPLSTLMEAGIRDILIISTPADTPRFEELLGDGKKFGIHIEYAVQPSPDGLAQAFIIGKDFIGDDSCAMVLGDNIFYGGSFSEKLKQAAKNAEDGFASVFCYYVNDPERFGVIDLDKSGNPVGIVEKSKTPPSNYAVTGLYFYPKGASKVASTIKKSARGEYEITDMNNVYLHNKVLSAVILGRGYTWLDAGTHESLIEAAEFVRTIEGHEGLMISCPEEIAYRSGWIDVDELIKDADFYGKSEYGVYLKKVSKGDILG